jgi:hypothetical protein
MEVNHRGRDIDVAQEVLDRSDIHAPFQNNFHAETRREGFEQKVTEKTKDGKKSLGHQAFWLLTLRPPLILFVAIRAIRGWDVLSIFSRISKTTNGEGGLNVLTLGKPMSPFGTKIHVRTGGTPMPLWFCVSTVFPAGQDI